MSLWLFDGRRFRVRPGQEAITGGLSAYHIPELKPLIMGLQRKGYDKFTLVFDPQRKQYYELSSAFVSDFTNPLRLKGLESWYLDVGFKPGDEFILSCIDFEADRFNIEHWPAEARDEAAINELNKTVAGGFGTNHDYIGALLLLYELTGALNSLRSDNYDIFIIHGPLVRSLGQYSDYHFDERDLKQVMGEDNFKDFVDYCWEHEKIINAPTYKRRPTPRRTTKPYLVENNFLVAVAFTINRIYAAARDKGTLIAGVVERSRSTELSQRMIFERFNELYKKNPNWFKSVVGKPFTGRTNTAKAKYIKEFLDNLGYTDTLLFGSILDQGDYSGFQESRANRKQSENREMGLDTGLIKRLEHLSELIPRSRFTYIRTSTFNAPFKVEVPDWLTTADEKRLIESIFAFSQFLPKYAFPVNLDVVDKVAKVSNWITNALMMVIRQEIFASLLKDRRPLTMDELLLLGGKAREWNIRPKASGMQYRRGF